MAPFTLALHLGVLIESKVRTGPAIVPTVNEKTESQLLKSVIVNV